MKRFGTQAGDALPRGLPGREREAGGLQRTSARGDLKALEADLNWVLYWGRERGDMGERRRGDSKVRRRLRALRL